MKVSVLTTTYNHEPFIAEAIESVMAQVVDFQYEQVIGEDCSTDRTREIVLDFQSRYPDRIRLLLHETNLGGRRNFVETFRACRGEYIALLEGDDYWTAAHKLQKQADFLDEHPECALCFCDVAKQYEAGWAEPSPLKPSPEAAQGRTPSRARPKTIYTLEDLLENNFISFCSTMFRAGLFDDFPAWFYTTPTGDWPLHVLNALHGEIGYIDEVMAVHRVHAGGVWSSKSISERRKNNIKTLKIFKENLGPQYEKRLEASIARWHLKVINALALEKDYRGIGSYLWSLLSSAAENDVGGETPPLHFGSLPRNDVGGETPSLHFGSLPRNDVGGETPPLHFGTLPRNGFGTLIALIKAAYWAVRNR